MEVLTSPPASHRLKSLDVLRGLAVLLVLGRHLPEGSERFSHWIVSFCQKWFQVGWMGVDLFFVLSGFLVSGLLFSEYIKTKKIRPGRFLIRRGLKIYPAYYFMTFVSFAILWKYSTLNQFLIEIFFVQNYFCLAGLWSHTWSLAIEEHFYLGLCVLFYFLTRGGAEKPFRLIPWIWLFSAIVCLWLRLNTPFNDPHVLTPTHVRMDGLLFGVMLSYFYHFYRAGFERFVKKIGWFLPVITFFCLWPVFCLDLGREPFLVRYGLTLTYLGFGSLILFFLFMVPVRVFSNPISKVFLFVGVRSYSIYLWHMPVVYIWVQPMTTKIGGANGLWVGLVAYLVGAVGVGVLSYEIIEKPVLAWRDRRFPASRVGLG